jgi:dihydroxy-acid dehydratase
MEYRGSGRPIRRDGAIASLDIPGPRPDVEVSDAELARRRAEWRAPQQALNGWLKRYAAMVTSGSRGTVVAV